MKQKHPPRQNWSKLALALALIGSGPLAHAISQTPLFLAAQPRPNIMFTFDDSGSMNWNCIPDELCPYDTNGQHTSFAFTNTTHNLNNAKWRSAAYNGLAYDPNVLYTPWSNYDGKSTWVNATPTNAISNPNTSG